MIFWISSEGLTQLGCNMNDRGVLEENIIHNQLIRNLLMPPTTVQYEPQVADEDEDVGRNDGHEGTGIIYQEANRVGDIAHPICDDVYDGWDGYMG